MSSLKKMIMWHLICIKINKMKLTNIKIIARNTPKKLIGKPISEVADGYFEPCGYFVPRGAN